MSGHHHKNDGKYGIVVTVTDRSHGPPFFLATAQNVAASTQAQALSDLLFLYRDVLDDPLPWLEDVVRARKPRRLPVVMTRDEVLRRVLGDLRGPPRLVAALPGAFGDMGNTDYGDIGNRSRRW